MTVFTISLFVFTAVMLAAAGMLLFPMRAVPDDSASFKFFESFPRNRMVGSILTIAVLFWCVPNIRPIITAGGTLDTLLLPLTVIAIVLAIVFLDYLTARALGAFCILLAHYFLKESYAVGIPWSGFFAGACFVLGTLGIFACGKPYLLRDWIRALLRKKNLRLIVLIYFLYAAVAACYIAFSLILKA